MVLVENLFYMNRGFFHFWGYFWVFVTLFLESAPFIGALIPGGTIALVLAGLLARLGFFSLWKLAIVAIVASVSIDTLNYTLGRMVKKDFLHRFANKLFVKKETLERVGTIAHGHTGKALILGRVNPVTRAIGPFVIGTEKVGFGKFIFFNIIGGILWVLMLLFIGYIFGGSFHDAGEMEHFVLWVTILLVGGFYGYFLITKLTRKRAAKCKITKHGLDCKK